MKLKLEDDVHANLNVHIHLPTADVLTIINQVMDASVVVICAYTLSQICTKISLIKR